MLSSAFVTSSPTAYTRPLHGFRDRLLLVIQLTRFAAKFKEPQRDGLVCPHLEGSFT